MVIAWWIHGKKKETWKEVWVYMLHHSFLQHHYIELLEKQCVIMCMNLRICQPIDVPYQKGEVLVANFLSEGRSTRLRSRPSSRLRGRPSRGCAWYFDGSAALLDFE